MSYRFYRRFSGDSGILPPGIQANDETSGGEALTEDDSELIPVVVQQPDVQQVCDVSICSIFPLVMIFQFASANNQGLISEGSFMRGSRFLPSEIWASPWEQPLSSLNPVTAGTIAERVFEGAGGNPDATLLVTGQSIDELVDSLEAIISDCTVSGDFTPLLLSHRTFQM